MKYILDTNVLLRVFMNDDDQLHSECTAVVQRIKENKLEAVLPDIVLSELVWVMKSVYGFKRREIAKVISACLATNGLDISSEYDYITAVELYGSSRAKYIDCVIATLVKNKNWTVISYDKDFDQLGVSRLEPRELLNG